MRSFCNFLVLSFVIILVACTTPVSQTAQVPATPLPTSTMVNAQSSAMPSSTTPATITSSIPPIELDSTETPAIQSYIATPSLPRPALQVQVKDLRQEGEHVKATVCFEVPDQAEWMIDHASLRYPGGETSFESEETLEYQPPLAGSALGYRCQEIIFTVPVKSDLSKATLTVQGLRATPNEGEYCERYLDEAQPTLTARQTGIKIGCTQSGNGFNLTVISKPNSLSLEEAQRSVYDFFTIPGPWIFPFSNPPVFDFQPLPYTLKASASNFRQEGEMVKVDVCMQIDNADWEAWQVQESILQYAGREDRYFGTSAQLRRVSPAGARYGKYCGTLDGFSELGEIPATARASDFILTITSLIPDVNVSNRCTTYLEQIQQRLDEQGMGIRVQCGKTAMGDYALQPVDQPASLGLSQESIERVLSNVGLFLFLPGPWRFEFK